MTTEYLREFMVLAEVGNFNRAAEMLFITQPVLTRHIQEMERELGTLLFTRTTRGAALTDAGRFLMRQAPEVLSACDSAVTQLKLGGLPIRGRLRIACNQELSYAAHLSIFMGRFMRRYQDLEVTIDVIPESMPASLLRDYDVVISPCQYPDIPPETRYQLLQRHSIYLYMYPGHRLMSRPEVALEDLAGETILVPYTGETFGPYGRNWQLTDRVLRGEAHCLRMPNLSTALFMLSTRAGGILLGPRYLKHLLPSDVFSGSMISHVSNEECCFEEILYTPRYERNGAARLFHEELLAACGPGLPRE